MSSTLGWIPVKKPKTRYLDNQLKIILRNKYGVSVIDNVMDEADIDYLTGLRDGGVKDAEKLINAIQKHGEICVSEEF